MRRLTKQFSDAGAGFVAHPAGRVTLLVASILVLGTWGSGLLAQFAGTTGGTAGAGQTQQSSQPAGALTGQVVSSTTGEPLRKVTLTLQPRGVAGGTRATATSDASGGFRFDKVAPGTYRLQGDRTGFVNSVYGTDQASGDPKDIEITSSKTVSGIVFKLTPHSVITGRVFDQDGDPLESAQVEVSHFAYPQGERELRPVARASTNDLGDFRVSGLAPGRYYVSASLGRPQQGFARGGLLGDSTPAPSEDYVATFYPRASEAESGTPIDLIPGSEVQGVDIGLRKSPMFTVSGAVTGIETVSTDLPPALTQLLAGRGGRGKGKGGGLPPQIVDQIQAQGGDVEALQAQAEQLRQRLGNRPNVMVALTPRAGNSGGGGRNRGNPAGATQVELDGSFTIPAVAPGSYYLIAQTRGGRGAQSQQQLSARTEVNVSSGNVSNLRLDLAPPLQLTGTIVPDEKDAEVDFSKARLNFQAQANTPLRGGPGRPQIEANGTFTAELAPDTYTVELSGLADGSYLKAVKMAGRELPNAQLDLSYAGGQLEIVVGTDAGGVSGRVENSHKEPMPNARVTLVPAADTPRRDLYFSATSGEDGSYTLSNVPPGKYEIYAWETVETNAWMDPLFRQPYEARAEDVEVKPGMTPDVTVELIERTQMLSGR